MTERRRENLITCPSCKVLCSPESLRCYSCGRLLKNLKELRELCEYYNEVADVCGVSDCIEGCCLTCGEVDTCIYRCFRSGELF